MNHVVNLEITPYPLFKKSLKSGFLLIFSAVVVYTFVDQFLNKQIEFCLRSPEGLKSEIWIWGFLSLITAIIYPFILTFFCSFFLYRTTRLENNDLSLKSFCKNNLELGFLESLRAWGVSLTWSLAFIIPGLIKYSYFLLTPLVVFFNPQYKLGSVDALKESERICKSFWLRLIFITFIFSILLPSLISVLFDEYRLVTKHPLVACCTLILDTVLIFYFNYVILIEFIKRTNIPYNTDTTGLINAYPTAKEGATTL